MTRQDASTSYLAAGRHLAAVAALATVPTFAALAQIIPTGTPAADILLSRAITEQRVFLTCSALDGLAHPQVLARWQHDTGAAITILTANAVPPAAIAAFAEAAKPANLLPAPDTPFADVRQLCDAHPDWQALLARSDLTILELDLPPAFE